MPSRDVPGLAAQDAIRCRSVLRAGSRSFHAASLLLPGSVRDAVAAVYAFCRTADDAIDGGGASRWTLLSLRDRLDRIYEGGSPLVPADRALSAVVHHYRIPRSVFDALIEGFAWELEERRYTTIAELRAYGVRVAGTVGIAVAGILGARDEETLARACDLGVAMQLTNIARDVGEDAAAGRLYLPREWMEDAGLDPDAWLRAPTFSAALSRVVQRVLEEADGLYRRAESGIERLPRRYRWAIRAARHMYADIGAVIARRGFDSVSGRAVTSTPRKIRLAVRALRPPGSTGVGAPALQEALELVRSVPPEWADPSSTSISRGPAPEGAGWHIRQELA
jgi:phytoene synthase